MSYVPRLAQSLSIYQPNNTIFPPANSTNYEAVHYGIFLILEFYILLKIIFYKQGKTIPVTRHGGP
jgi:hypothetical protein